MDELADDERGTIARKQPVQAARFGTQRRHEFDGCGCRGSAPRVPRSIHRPARTISRTSRTLARRFMREGNSLASAVKILADRRRRRHRPVVPGEGRVRAYRRYGALSSMLSRQSTDLAADLVRRIADRNVNSSFCNMARHVYCYQTFEASSPPWPCEFGSGVGASKVPPLLSGVCTMLSLRSIEVRGTSPRAAITRTVVWVSVAFAMLALSSPLQADAHRARLSRGLAESVGAGKARAVIVSGTEAQVRDLAARHGLVLEKTLETGGVLQGGRCCRARAARSRSDGAGGGRRCDRLGAHGDRGGGARRRSGVGGRPRLARRERRGRGHRVDRLRHRRAARGAAPAGRGERRLRGERRDAAATRTATARTWPGSWPVTSRRREGRFSGVAPGAHIVSLRVLDEQGQGSTSDVIAAIDWADRQPCRVPPAGDQPLARQAGARELGGRSAGAGGRARQPRRARGRGVGGQLGHAAGRHARARRHHVAGQRAVGDHGRRDRHDGHARRAATTASPTGVRAA